MTVAETATLDRELRLPAVPAELSGGRRFVDDAARQFGMTEDERQTFVFAANEAMANAIEHGSPCSDGAVGVHVVCEDDSLALYVSDCGVFGGRQADPDPLGDRGRGLALMAAVVDEIELKPGGDRTIVRLAKRRS